MNPLTIMLTSLALVGALSMSTRAAASERGCDDLIAQRSSADQASRAITAMDLVRLRDLIGRTVVTRASGIAEYLFDVSPDGGRIAFLVRRGDPTANGYCTGVFVADLRRAAPVRLVYASFEPVDEVPAPPMVEVSRYPALIAPQWSPDGQWIAFLRREQGVINIWRARVDGSAAERVSNSGVDVENLSWTADGRSIIFESRPGTLTAIQAREAEGRTGFHYDERFTLQRSQRPNLIDLSPTQRFIVDVQSKDVRAYTGEWQNEPRGLEARSTRGAVQAEVRSPAPNSSNERPVLEIRWESGRRLQCVRPECRNIRGLWWDPTGQWLSFLNREGWNSGSLALYRWRPGVGSPRRVFITEDHLTGCERVREGLVCVREGPSTPRRIVLIEPESGSTREVFDPNPETANWQFGQVQRIQWRTAIGSEAFGYLILPPSHAQAQRLPLIVVGYQARGFLRGGSGDEVPIFALAARGFAVLSYDRPLGLRMQRTSSGGTETEQAIQAIAARTRDWVDRRDVQSALERGIAELDTRGIVDVRRIGITGFSDGATTAQWMLISSDLFATAALTHCCAGPSAVMGGILGTHVVDRHIAYGYPRIGTDDEDFWRPAALERNVERVRTPILVQSDDQEYLYALPTHTRFRDMNRPFDLFVFPGEGHIKWQPAHRLAIYQRNLDWLDFWLRGIENDTPGRPAEYARWRVWRDERNADASRPAAAANPIPSAPGDNAAPAVAR